MRLARASVVAVGLVAALACNKPEAPPPSLDDNGNTTPGIGGGGGTRHDGGTDGGDGGDASCTSIANVGGTINETFVGEALPSTLGGTIAVGTYVLTGAFVYTGVGGASGPTGRLLSETIVLDGQQFFDAGASGSADAGTLGATGFSSGGYVANGAQLTLNAECPASTSVTIPFTASGNTLRLYSGQSERVFTLQ